MKDRGSGILLHLTSLPSPFGIGDMGPSAYRFADFLAETKQSYWQILPLNPTDLGHHNSPYHNSSAFACNPLLISPEFLVQEGLLTQEDLEPLPGFPVGKIDYKLVMMYKNKLFQQAFDRFRNKKWTDEYKQFCLENAYWLDDFALFLALKSHFKGQYWIEWPKDLRDREPHALKSCKKDLHDKFEKERFLQYVFFKHWRTLKKYCNEKGIWIIGDIPFYVTDDSADIWVHSGLFNLDREKRPHTLAGVPPDYFSATGQLWGNPVYRWSVLKERRYDWWVHRIGHNLKLFDFVRVDHFRGFVAYWEVPAAEKNAINGKWIEAPAEDFFSVILEKFPKAPIIAEDLGLITPAVWGVMDRFGLPGMKVLLFAFDEHLPANPYAPHNHVKNCIVYTGTHDNNTARGWFENEAAPDIKERLFQYLGRQVTGEEVHLELIRLAMMSVANTAIFPLQDILGLGEQARMNRPAKKDGNWQWRLLPNQITPDVARRLLEMTEIYGRARMLNSHSVTPHP